MKGYINERGKFIAPCITCKYKDYLYIEQPCSKCVDVVDIIFEMKNEEKNFRNYTPDETTGL